MPKTKRELKETEYIETIATKFSNGSHAILPKDWVDKKVIVLKL